MFCLYMASFSALPGESVVDLRHTDNTPLYREYCMAAIVPAVVPRVREVHRRINAYAGDGYVNSL